MSIEKNIELIKQLLREKGFAIHPISEGVMVYAYRDNHTLVCSLLGENLTVSISFYGAVNLKKATRIAQEVFGKKFTVEHLSNNPLDGKQASYFSCKVFH